ncbi:MAG: adenylyl-sulfate kinase [Nocardiaceae bacterium]|nr:adenylyl-sulfate kinase [Nocardiaceae bacterium]
MKSQLLRVATAGSVDDGKSTLIGRLLYDSKSIFEDQLEAVERTSEARGDEQTNLALLTDGLRAEREQGITIDVAYRYFATPHRKFIIADTPGHEQYTRNMVTGASTADLALILVDARHGIVEQTRRHAFIASLLGLPHVVVCINKMDLVDWSQERYLEIEQEFRKFATKLEVKDLSFIPVSALLGDNVVDKTENMPWYQGTSLLHHLEQVHVSSDRNLIDARFPVQYVIRPQKQTDQQMHDFRGYAGTVSGGVFKPGDDVVTLPSGFPTKVKAIWAPGGTRVDEAFAGMAVTIELTDNIDISRGDVLCRPQNRPHLGNDIDAMVCWFSPDVALNPSSRFTLMHTTKLTKAKVARIDYKLNVNTLHRDETAESLSLNEIGRVQLRIQTPLLFDAYRRNRTTGSFILIDEMTNNTVGAGMITGPTLQNSNVVWHDTAVSRDQRSSRGGTIWLTGLSGSGKSSVAVELERRLVASGRNAYRLDGDNLRHGLNADLRFTHEDRVENVRRIGEVARILADAGVIAIASIISPYAEGRNAVREMHAKAGIPFAEVFVDTPLEVCEARDVKGLYAKARAGEIKEFTGISDPYEAPAQPTLHFTPADGGPGEIAAKIFEWINS